MFVTNRVVSTATKKKLEYIEGYVIVTTILTAFLVGFGSHRRRSHNGLLKTSIFIAYVLPMPLVAYTFGQMQSADFHNEMFLVWALFLLIFSGSADCISVYSLEDNENHSRYILEVLFNIYMMNQWLSLYFNGVLSLSVIFFQVFALNRTIERYVALGMASRYGLVRSNKLIADFMAYEHKLSNEDEVDPVSMKGFKYLVKGEGKEQVKVVPPHNQNQLQLTGKDITIDMIWQCEGRLLSSTGDPDGRLKDICLSYALYRLLCRRFAGYPFFESSQVKTWNFVRYGLLSNEDDHERAFRVIEVELAFVYDLFYTKYAAIFSNKGFFQLRSIQFIIVIVGCVTMVPILTNYHTPKKELNLLTDGGHNVDVLVTRIVVVAILFMELVQYFVFSFSDWTKVQWLCRYVKKPSWQNNKCIEKIIQIVCHRKWLKPWERNLGQYSLLESYNYNPSRLLYNRCITSFVNNPRNGQTESNRIKLPLEVKKAIIVSLRTLNGQRLKNGEASLQRNGEALLQRNGDELSPQQNQILDELSWACRLETQTHVIMVWHIATSLCEKECKQDNLVMKSTPFIVANA